VFSRQKNSGRSKKRSITADGGGTTMIEMSRQLMYASQTRIRATKAITGGATFG